MTAADTGSIMLIILSVLCTTISWVVTCIGINQHLNHWNSPAHQKIVVKMLALVLIWSLFATIVVIRPQLLMLVKIFMDTYEAYIVVLFMSLMCVYLGGVDAIDEVIQEMPKFRFLFCLRVRPSRTVYNILRFSVYQFAFFKPFFSIARFIVYYLAKEAKIDWNVQKMFMIFQIATLFSLITAMMALLNFYKMFAQALAPYKVAAKFMAIKLFIFLHLVQAFIMGSFENEENHNRVVQLEYFTLCFEMTVAAFLLQSVIFTYREFLTDTTPQKPWLEYFRLDDTRLAEWKSVLSAPHIVRQDSYFTESAQITRTNSEPSNEYHQQSAYSSMINNIYY